MYSFFTGSHADYYFSGTARGSNGWRKIALLGQSSIQQLGNKVLQNQDEKPFGTTLCFITLKTNKSISFLDFINIPVIDWMYVFP